MAVRKKWDPEGSVCGFLDAADRSGVEGIPKRRTAARGIRYEGISGPER